VTLRHLFSWKSLFYDAALPLLRWLGPARGDAALGRIGRAVAAVRPGMARRVAPRLAEARAALGADWDLAAIGPAVVANIPRYLARDYPLDSDDDARALARFDVDGASHLDDALARGRGVVLVGSHLGAHVAGLHWLHRRGVPVRMLVQRPGHVSRSLRARFDGEAEGPHPQAKMSLRRGLPTREAADRLLRAHAALRDGYAVYLNGDIPWPGRNARPGRLLGPTRPFLSVWADLAVLSRSPAVFVSCTHAPGGRYALEFAPPIDLAPGDEPRAVAAYFANLEAAIARDPAEAVAHLTWPCFGPGTPTMPCDRARSRRGTSHTLPSRATRDRPSSWSALDS